MKRCAFLCLVLTLAAVLMVKPVTADPPDYSSDADALFETDPTAAVSDATGQPADGVSAAQPRAGGGAIVESADSLTTPDGRVVENVVDAEIDGSGNLLRAGEMEFEGSRFRGVTEFRTMPGGFSATVVDELDTGMYVLSGGVSVQYQNNKLYADIAKSLERGSAVASYLRSLDAAAEQFSVGSADSVVQGCAELKNLKDATIVVSKDAIEARPDSNASVEAVDCSGSESSFNGDNSYVKVTTIEPGRYAIGPGRIVIDAGNGTDTIETDSSASIDVEEGAGVSCMQIGPESTYWFNAEDVVRDFGIHIPREGSDYQLCLRKKAEQQFADFEGLVDFIDRTIELAGIVTYLRLPVENGQPVSLIMDPVYEGLDRGNIARMNLDGRFSAITSIMIVNERPGIGMLSLVNSGSYAVYEYGTGTEIRRYGRFNERRFPDLITRYSSQFGASTPPVFFRDGVLIQEGEDKQGSITKVTAVCDGCLAKSDFESRMAVQEYAFPLAAGRCGT